jgi:hypothetical protein
MREGLRGLQGRLGPPMKDPVRFQFAVTLAQRPATRDEGLKFLEWGFTESFGYGAITQLALGRLREAGGDREGALDAYSQFIRLWASADDDMQGRVTEARDAVRRLNEEPTGR